uniref:winged helix-turn-helix domain-containing protein n=1 Tax=Thaumasiovibrio occultus TaxID=1891184 RepID=UPI000B35EA3E|nr:winged helix-turn-helix domain-containing protein [Thaumasiovibrio occultus]
MNKINNTLILGEFSWCTSSREIHRIDEKPSDNDKTILTPKQYLLLECLYQAYPHPIDKEQIIAHVWGTQHISNESLPQLIIRTRKTLEDKEKSIIVNMPGKGYLLSFKQSEAPAPVIENINKPKAYSLAQKITVLGLALLTGINAMWCIKAKNEKDQFHQVMFSTPYPYIKPVGNGELIIQVGQQECHFDSEHSALECK